ncbi:DNA internalization-related competence protein ComEC/Rec2 [Halopseudomonas nanhaiensis]|uniref:DNA internalization-related competence protein ComEC/Rec2 n=1 Tax=Halopseudomonas nanhaiensis TaxID=2830842 RepID=UPI001CC00D37|nr:DNA internalization-related competence protein ComEC/Rec2 [Halopseudomonas nanhaiensis]UAW96970.1 DNA internalization-related competence protein ComEC/Rec2 [Halopseudomonas nanhaiensis]
MSLTLSLAALFAGLITPLSFPTLPPLWVVGLAMVAGFAAMLHRLVRPLALFMLGLVWALTYHHWMLSERLPEHLDNKRAAFTGTVAGLPEPTGLGWRFLIKDARLVDTGEALPLIRAHWYSGAPVQPGERWHFDGSLRRPRGMSNPGGFDYEAWLYAQGIGAVASVRAADLMEDGGSGLSGWRRLVRHRLGETLSEQPGADRLIALVVGDRSVLDDRDWDILQATGTGHLMVISGLHVGMVAAAVFGLVSVVGWLGVLRVPWPQQWLAAPLALAAAALYAGLAGFAVPTQRALLMVALLLLARLRYRQINPWVFWLAALCAVAALAPAAPLRAGFWLSFVAVGLLLLGMSGRLAIRGLWWRWGRAQWVIFVGLWPWLLLWGMPGSLTAPVVNLVAIPWVSLLVVPAALLGTVADLYADFSWLLVMAAHALNGLFALLTLAASWQGPVGQPFPGWGAWLVGVTGALILVSPLAGFLRVPALACLLVLFVPPTAPPEPGGFRVTVLDVGQGLSVLVQTRSHVLLYDTGARLRSGFDLGEAVVSPALQELGVRQIDLLLLSHADNDHAGGASAVIERFPTRRVLSGQASELAALNAQPCEPGESWKWDDVEFRIVYSAQPPAPANERSCVLHIASEHGSVLLPGDLGVRGEYQMLDESLQSELLLAPHHGSRTSSSYAFIRAVSPRWVVFSSSYHSPFGHPHPKVVERYRELHAEPVYTARSGALQFDFGAADPDVLSWRWRDQMQRFWHE